MVMDLKEPPKNCVTHINLEELPIRILVSMNRKAGLLLERCLCRLCVRPHVSRAMVYKGGKKPVF